VSKPYSQRFRILSLDGGGIKGAFTASVLSSWESTTGLRIRDHFDLIAGTSTGGILAIGLGLGEPASSILEFYKHYGPEIFPNARIVQRLNLALSNLWRPKYSQTALRDALTKVFGQKRFGESTCRLVIPTYDAIQGRIFLMKTAHSRQFQFDYSASAVDVALATSAAPTFFEPAAFTEHEGNLYVDGGVWANCPALCAVIEAHHFLGIPLEDIHVLSVGTTSEPTGLFHKLERGPFGFLQPGIIRWAPQLLGLLFQAQMEASLAISSLLIKERFIRVDEITPEGAYKLDSSGKIKQLAALGRSCATQTAILDRVRAEFLDGIPAEPFTPIYRIQVREPENS